MIAILPAAGRGKRMASVTGGAPKELLEVGGKPVLQWVIEESEAAGAQEIVVISAPGKKEIADFLERVPCRVKTRLVIQEEPIGLAPAASLAGGGDSALVLLPDTLYFPESPCARLTEALAHGADIAVAAEQVSSDQVSQYGIVALAKDGKSILRIVEKPNLRDAPSRWAVAGRYALSRRMMQFLPGGIDSLRVDGEELTLSPVLNAAIEKGFTATMVTVSNREGRFDCGQVQGYERAEAVLAGGRP